MTKKLLFSCVCFLLCAMTAKAAAVSITGQGGWFESAYVTWQKTAGLAYNVYVSPASSDSWTKLDDELVREYPTYGRADALGLKAGSYKFKVVPVSGDSEVAADAAVSSAVEVKAHDRSGFAHKQAGTTGIGAYNNDGTLKANARVVYVWANNAKTVSLDVATNSKGSTATYTGLQQIIYGYQKGDANGSYDKRPLCVRIIGTIKDTDIDTFLSNEGIQVKGAKSYMPMNITIEGVGNDAIVWGFGFLIRNAASVEFRNFGIMLCMDDAVSIDTENEMVWIHNLDLFYGKPGSDADQAKGDGTIDMKGNSRYLTVSYNHLYDSGKASLCGMKSEGGPNWITYHHNWFDHSDSRHPRIRTMSVHVYNNYFDGNAKYGVGTAYRSEAFVENNYFRNCKYPMLSSKQGSDVAGGGEGTFSGEDGGVIKSFGNVIVGARSIVTYQQDHTEFDCWEASTRNAQVPVTVAAKQGGKTYSNFDTDVSIMYGYTPDAADNVPGIVKGQYGAGRMQHGDFTWTFNNSLQDENYNVIDELKSRLQNYKSTLVGFFGGNGVSNGGASSAVNSGDGIGLTEEQQDYTPHWAGGGGAVSAGLPDPRFSIVKTEGGSQVYDYLWFNSTNETAIKGYISGGWLTYSDGTSFNATRELKNTGGDLVSKYTGSLQIPVNGYATFKCEKGFSSVIASIFRTGGAKGEIQLSKNGSSFSKIADYSGSKGDAVINASANETSGPVYVRITNGSTGSLHITGIKVMYPDPDVPNYDPDPEDPDPEDELSSDASADFDMDGGFDTFTNGVATKIVAYDDAATSFTISVTPAQGATVKSVTGATGSNGTYAIKAPAAGGTATATFSIVAENQTSTRTYTVNIVKGVDPATQPQTDGEFLYFPNGSKTYNSFYTVIGNTSNGKGATTYIHNGETYNCNYVLKLETSTSIKFKPTKNGVLKIGLSSQGNNNLKLNGTKLTGNANYIVEANVTADTEYTITKADVAHIFYIDLVYADDVLRGDADGNGEVEPADALALANHLIGNSGSYDAKAADVNKDGKVDITDLVALIKKLIP